MAETVGSLADKISIMELKIFHMNEQLSRVDSSTEHNDYCRDRIKILTLQRDDLCTEADELMHALLLGRKELKVYRQCKMYNDPRFRSPHD